MKLHAVIPGLRGARVPLLGLGLVTLLCALWGGLSRLPVNLPTGRPEWALLHGPLLVCGFLGTVISLERAVGLPDRWPYLAPALIGAAGAHIVTGGPLFWGVLQLVVGSALFFVVTLRVIHLRRELFSVTMSLGALCWLVGNGLWLAHWPLPQIVPWWLAFLGLTLIGERIDLSRFQKFEPAAQPLFYVAAGAFLLGVLLTLVSALHGQRVLGVGLVALAAWLARFDLARRTVREPGLARFMALSLLSGFVWLAVAGALFLGWAPQSAGLGYDAAVHAFFLGFVGSMIFGHAPIIFPSVLGLTSVWRPRFYLHLGLLHASLLVRVSGDLLESVPVRQWGGILNAVALVGFLVNTGSALVGQLRTRRAAGSNPGTDRDRPSPTVAPLNSAL